MRRARVVTGGTFSQSNGEATNPLRALVDPRQHRVGLATGLARGSCQAGDLVLSTTIVTPPRQKLFSSDSIRPVAGCNRVERLVNKRCQEKNEAADLLHRPIAK